jgi:hypothetical protein
MKKSINKHLKRYFLGKFKEMGIEPIPLETWKKKSKHDLPSTFK